MIFKLIFLVIGLNAAKICDDCQADIVTVYDVAYYKTQVQQNARNASLNFIQGLIDNVKLENGSGSRMAIMMAGGSNPPVESSNFSDSEYAVIQSLYGFQRTIYLQMMTDRIVQILQEYKQKLLPQIRPGVAPMLISMIHANHKLDTDEALKLSDELAKQGVIVKLVVVHGDMDLVAGFGSAVYDGRDGKLNPELMFRLYEELIPVMPSKSRSCPKQLVPVQLSVLAVFDSSIDVSDVFQSSKILKSLKAQANLTQLSFFVGDQKQTRLVSTSEVVSASDVDSVVNSSIIPELTSGNGMDLNRAMTTGYVFLTKQNPKIRPVLVLVTKNATDTDWEKAASVASHLKNGLNVAIIVLTTKAANSIVFQKLKKIASPGMAFELPNVKPDNVLSAFSDAACFCNNGQQFIFGEDHPTYFADCFGIFTENVNGLDDASKFCQSWQNDAIPAIVPSNDANQFLQQSSPEPLQFFMNLKRTPDPAKFEWIGYHQKRSLLNDDQLKLVNVSLPGDCVVSSLVGLVFPQDNSWDVVDCSDHPTKDVVCQVETCSFPENPCSFDNGGFGYSAIPKA